MFGDAAFVHQPQQIAVRADVVEPVIVHADVGDVRRHDVDECASRPISRNSLVAGGIELQDRRAELKALRPLGPAAAGVLAPTVNTGEPCAGFQAASSERIFSAEAENNRSTLARSPFSVSLLSI